MFEGLIAAIKNSDLRKKILFTVMILLLYRVGALIPVPFVDTSMLGTVFQNSGLTDMLNIMSGGALQNAALFAMGISPYINASIIVQLLTIAIPALENLKKQEDGQKKINKITRYLTIALGLVMGFGYFTILKNAMGILTESSFFAAAVIVNVPRSRM